MSTPPSDRPPGEPSQHPEDDAELQEGSERSAADSPGGNGAPRRVLYSEGDDEVGFAEAEAASDSPSNASSLAKSDGRQIEPRVLAAPYEVAAAKRFAFQRAREHLDRLSRKRRQPTQTEWMQRPLEELPVCIIDLETTGGANDSDEILEVGAVLLRGHHLVREFSSLVDPERPITKGAQSVHRITQADITGAPRVGELLPWIRELAETRVLLFHNAGFDLGFLQRAFHEAGQEPLRQPVVDTVVLARRLMGGRCGLGVLGQRLAIDLPHAHRALADARLTAQVWLELLEVLEEAGATTLGQVPGVVSRAPRHRRRTRPRNSELLQMFESAIAMKQALEVAYRASRGAEPLLMQVLPQQIFHNRYCRVVDRDTRCEKDLSFDRVELCKPVP